MDKEGKIDISKLAIHENNANKAKMVFSYNLRAIASQSTEVGWTSCQDLQKHPSLHEDRYRDEDDDDNEEGRYVHYVGAGASDGVFICYLVKAGNEYTLDRPTARVLFKPYFGQLTGDIIWKPDKIYGTAPDSFRTMAQAIIDKVIHPKQDIYELTKNTYVDQPLRDQKVIHNIDWTKLSQIELGKIVFNPKSHGKTKELVIPHLRDQIILTKLVKDPHLEESAWERAFDKIKSQRTVMDICLNDKNWKKRIYALKRVDNPQILEKIILGTKETDNDIKAEALIKLGNKKPEIFDKIVEDKAQKREFRADVIKTAHIDPKILEKILYDEDDSFNVRKAVVENLDEKMLKDLVESGTDINLRFHAINYITPKMLEEFALHKTLNFDIRKWVLHKLKVSIGSKENKEILYKKIVLDKEEDPEMQMLALDEIGNPEHKDLKSLALETTNMKLKWKVLSIMYNHELLSKEDDTWLPDVLCELNEDETYFSHDFTRSHVKTLLGFITEDKTFIEMMNKMKKWSLFRKYIVEEKIKDNDFLYKIIMDEKNENIEMKSDAIQNPHFKDQKYLEKIALDKELNEELRILAIEKVESLDVLKLIAEGVSYFASKLAKKTQERYNFLSLNEEQQKAKLA